MSRFCGIKCDVCEGVGVVTQAQTPPFGWIPFSHAGKDIEVCGLKCFNKWGKDRAKLEKEAEALTPEEFCEIHCEFEVGDEQNLHNDVCPLGKAWAH